MRPLLLALFLGFLPVTEAHADACDILIDNAQGALANPSLAPVERNFLEELLKAGRAAKAAGDVTACQNALQSPQPFRDPSKGRDCNETPDTV
jgi:hypothetical protein